MILVVVAPRKTGAAEVRESAAGDPVAGRRSARRADGEIRLVEDGKEEAPAVLLVGNAAASTYCWDPVVPLLASTFRVLRVDLLGEHGSARPPGGHDVSSQARRVAAALDRIGVRPVAVIGHSAGCAVATAFAEQRPESVTAVALLDFGPGLADKVPEPLAVRLLLTRVPGRLLWSLRTKNAVRKAARSSFVRPVEIPDAWIEHVLRMTHQEFVNAMRAPVEYLEERSLPDRLRALGLALLVVFGADDGRWRASSARSFACVPGARVEVLPGVGHTPMMEDPETTGRLLAEFAKMAVAAG